MAHGKQVNRAELAQILAVSLPTINAMIKRGMPFEQRGSRGKEWIFNTADVLDWRTEQAVIDAVGDTNESSEDELRRRKLAAETTIVEISAAKERGEVVYIDDAVKMITDDYIAAKSRLRNIPLRVAVSLVGETDERKVKDILISEIDEALTDCANQFIAVGEEFSEAD